MIIYPSIDKLLDKIDSKYSLCTIASKRAKQIHTYKDMILDDYHSPKEVGKALEEIASNDLVIDPESLNQ